MAEAVPEGTTELKLLDRMVNRKLGCSVYLECRCSPWANNNDHCFHCGHPASEH